MMLHARALDGGDWFARLPFRRQLSARAVVAINHFTLWGLGALWRLADAGARLAELDAAEDPRRPPSPSTLH